MMLVQTRSSPTAAMRWAIRPRGCRTRSETMFVSRRNRCSEFDGLVGQLLDGGEILVYRLQGSEQCQKGFRRRRLDDQPSAVLSHDGVLARQLELARDAHGLV